jgi:hypothetical protein
MKTTMLAYSKLILGKVSFCEVLFEKELRKFLGELSREERFSLQVWCNHQFGGKYRKIINRAFYSGSVANLQPLGRDEYFVR